MRIIVIPADRLCRNGYISQFFTNSFKLVIPANTGIQYNIKHLKDWIPACAGMTILENVLIFQL